jgi:polyisoprenoid-binding protein YceI
MKPFILLALVCGILLSGCSHRVQSGAAQGTKPPVVPSPPATSLTVYTVRTDLSTVHWSGSSGKKKHTGTLQLKDGRLLYQNTELVSGSFVLNVASLQVTDLGMPEKGYLEAHLNKADFFETEKYPTATFVIDAVDRISPAAQPAAATKSSVVATHRIKGTLTIKGISNSISFDAALAEVNGRVMVATDEFFISRSAFGITYGDKKEADGKISRKIDDEMGIRIELGAEYVSK